MEHIRDRNGKIQYTVDGSKVKNVNGETVYNISNGKIKDKDGKTIAESKDGFIKDFGSSKKTNELRGNTNYNYNSGQSTVEFNKNNIKDRSSSEKIASSGADNGFLSWLFG